MNDDILFQEQPLVIRPALAMAFGLNEAIVLQQINYWIGKDKVGKVHFGRRWVRNTYEQWQVNFPFWSVTTIRRILKNLTNYGVVLATDKLNKRKGDQTKWYTIDQEALRIVYDTLQKGKQPTETTEDDPLSKMGAEGVQYGQGGCPEWTGEVSNMDRPLPETTQRLPENRSTLPASPDKSISGKTQKQVVRPAIIPEPTYGNPGDEFGDGEPASKKPKYLTPDTALAIRALHACGRLQYKKIPGTGEKTQWKQIEKGMMPLTSGITSKFPTEWVNNRIEIAEKMNGRKAGSEPFSGGVKMTFPNLLAAIKNEEKKIDWVARAEEEVVVDSLDLPEGVDLGAGMQEEDPEQLKRFLEQERAKMLE